MGRKVTRYDWLVQTASGTGIGNVDLGDVNGLIKMVLLRIPGAPATPTLTVRLQSHQLTSLADDYETYWSISGIAENQDVFYMPGDGAELVDGEDLPVDSVSSGHQIPDTDGNYGPRKSDRWQLQWSTTVESTIPITAWIEEL